MDRWFGDFGRRGLHPFGRDWLHFPESMAPFAGKLPKVDLIDRENELVVRAELPGVSKDDVEVTVEEFNVTIKATTKQEHKEEEGEYYRRELSSGEYQRTLALPASVDEEKAQASFTDGVLELTLPKQEKTRRKSVKVE
jgi:HSP20 family protein